MAVAQRCQGARCRCPCHPSTAQWSCRARGSGAGMRGMGLASGTRPPLGPQSGCCRPGRTRRAAGAVRRGRGAGRQGSSSGGCTGPVGWSWWTPPQRRLWRLRRSLQSTCTAQQQRQQWRQRRRERQRQQWRQKRRERQRQRKRQQLRQQQQQRQRRWLLQLQQLLLLLLRQRGQWGVVPVTVPVTHCSCPRPPSGSGSG